jgi:hypothetical protein
MLCVLAWTNARHFARGKDVVARDPFIYQSYLTTCHPSPSQAFASTSVDLSDVENVTDGNDSIDGENSTEDVLPLTKASVLHLWKQIMSDLEPANKERYEETFVTWEIMQANFSKILRQRSFIAENT